MLLSLPQIPSFWRLGLMLGCDQGHVTLELTCSLTRYLVSHIQQPAGISMWIFNRHHPLTNFYPYPIHWSLPISLNGTSILRVVQDRNLEGLLAFHSFPHTPHPIHQEIRTGLPLSLQHHETAIACMDKNRRSASVNPLVFLLLLLVTHGGHAHSN